MNRADSERGTEELSLGASGRRAQGLGRWRNPRVLGPALLVVACAIGAGVYFGTRGSDGRQSGTTPTGSVAAQGPIRLSLSQNYTVSGNRTTRIASYDLTFINGSSFKVQVRYDPSQSLPDGILSTGPNQTKAVTLGATGGTAALNLQFEVQRCTPPLSTANAPMRFLAKGADSTSWSEVTLAPPTDGTAGDTWQKEIVGAICGS